MSNTHIRAHFSGRGPQILTDQAAVSTEQRPYKPSLPVPFVCGLVTIHPLYRVVVLRPSSKHLMVAHCQLHSQTEYSILSLNDHNNNKNVNMIFLHNSLFLFLHFFYSFIISEHKTVLWIVPHTLCIHIIHDTATEKETEKHFFLHTAYLT